MVLIVRGGMGQRGLDDEPFGGGSDPVGGITGHQCELWMRGRIEHRRLGRFDDLPLGHLVIVLGAAAPNPNLGPRLQIGDMAEEGIAVAGDHRVAARIGERRALQQPRGNQQVLVGSATYYSVVELYARNYQPQAPDLAGGRLRGTGGCVDCVPLLAKMALAPRHIAVLPQARAQKHNADDHQPRAEAGLPAEDLSPRVEIRPPEVGPRADDRPPRAKAWLLHAKSGMGGSATMVCYRH